MLQFWLQPPGGAMKPFSLLCSTSCWEATTVVGRKQMAFNLSQYSWCGTQKKMMKIRSPQITLDEIPLNDLCCLHPLHRVRLTLFVCRHKTLLHLLKFEELSFFDDMSRPCSRSSFGSVCHCACVLSSSINGFVTRSLCREVKYTSQLPSAVKQIFSQQLRSCTTRWLRWCCWHSAHVTVQDVLQWRCCGNWNEQCVEAVKLHDRFKLYELLLQSENSGVCVCSFYMSHTGLQLFFERTVLFGVPEKKTLKLLFIVLTRRVNLWIIEW